MQVCHQKECSREGYRGTFLDGLGGGALFFGAPVGACARFLREFPGATMVVAIEAFVPTPQLFGARGKSGLELFDAAQIGRQGGKPGGAFDLGLALRLRAISGKPPLLRFLFPRTLALALA